jgi:hypothetical protein
LLALLIPAIEAAGRQVVLVALHDPERWLPSSLASLTNGRLPGSLVLAIDGYEQLSRWNRWRTRRFCNQHDFGLLVTAHADVGLPLIAETKPDLPMALRIVRRLTDDPNITDDDVARAFDRCQGNVREALFDLYDLYEQRRPR